MKKHIKMKTKFIVISKLLLKTRFLIKNSVDNVKIFSLINYNLFLVFCFLLAGCNYTSVRQASNYKEVLSGYTTMVLLPIEVEIKLIDTSIDGVKFGGDVVIVGSTAKLAGKLVLEGGVKKVFTKSDTPHHKTHADTGGHKIGADAGLDNTHPSTPVGHKGKELTVPHGTNKAIIIDNRQYSGHALDRMQERGFTPMMVEHVIEKGAQSAGNLPNRIKHFDSINKVTIVTENGNVVTVRFGGD